MYQDQEPGVIVGHMPREIAKACYFFPYMVVGQITGEVKGCQSLICFKKFDILCRIWSLNIKFWCRTPKKVQKFLKQYSDSDVLMVTL